MMNTLENAMNMMSAIEPLTVTMEETAFVPMFCVLAETWCNAHNRDVTEFIATVSTLINEINHEFGPYIC